MLDIPKPKRRFSAFHRCNRCGEPLEFGYSTPVETDIHSAQQVNITALCSAGCEGTYTITSELTKYPTPPKHRFSILIHEGNNEGTVHVNEAFEGMEHV